MSSNTLTRFDASFANGSSEATDLVITLCENGLYQIEGRYASLHTFGFPSTETVERTGGAYADDVGSLVDKLMVSCHQGWYHHYRTFGHTPADNYGLGCWSIRVERNGSVERWEGLGHAPRGLDNVYDELIAFGMPPLRRGRMNGGSFEMICGPAGSVEFTPWHITSYRHLLDAALDADHDATGDDPPFDDRGLLFDEFVDDIVLHLEQCCPDALDRHEFERVWRVDDELAQIVTADPDKANRREMLMLFGALARISPTHGEIEHLVRSGILERWCMRLDEIPLEERAATRRIEQEKNLALRERIDESVRRFAARKKPFTSYDIAKDCGVTAQKASGRIRMLVKRGEIRPLDGTLPRKYLAA